jgi:hypothetical protein
MIEQMLLNSWAWYSTLGNVMIRLFWEHADHECAMVSALPRRSLACRNAKQSFAKVRARAELGHERQNGMNSVIRSTCRRTEFIPFSSAIWQEA